MKRRKIIPYRQDLVKKARYLRNNSTPGEIELWLLLKNNQLLGFDFDRQRPILNYIVDFYCKDLMLAIEIDGVSHDYKFEYDRVREIELRGIGIQVLRFTESDAKNNTEGVVCEIRKWILMHGTTGD